MKVKKTLKMENKLQSKYLKNSETSILHSKKSTENPIFKALLEQLDDSVVICDPSGSITWANMACLKLHNVNPVGSNLDNIPEVWGRAYDQNNELIPENQWALPRALKGEKVNLECILEDRTKKSCYFNITAEPIISALGEIIGAVSIARDISDRKMYEKATEANYLKEQKLNREIENQIQLKNMFFNVIIHELRTMLTPLIGSSEMLKKRLITDHDVRLANNIYRGANELNRRLSDLIDMAKNDAGVLKINPTTFEIRTLLDDVVNYVTPEAQIKQIKLKYIIDDKLSTIYADPERVHQIISNLLDNAFKFTKPDGQITIKARMDEDKFLFEINDSGCGISKKTQKSLFNQSPMLIQAKGPNALGIGLPLSRILVELHGGNIWVNSTKDKGSTFGFSLPQDATISKINKRCLYANTSNRR